MGRKIAIFFVILAIILVLGALFFMLFLAGNITGKSIIYEHSYTRALCNDTNYCRDYEVVCSGRNLISLNPTGYSVQLPVGWEDPRNNKNLENLC